MNQSNSNHQQLDGEQSKRLIQLFEPSFDQCLQEAAIALPGKPLVWQPILTDVHDQVVHRINPVLVQAKPVTADSPPTLFLTLLSPPAESPTNQVAPGEVHPTTNELIPVPKPSL